MMDKKKPKESSTSWEPVGQWYQNAVGDEGHYYHKNIVIPGILRLLNLDSSKPPLSVLDIACGQGVLARHLPEHVAYTGLDISPTLIKTAKQLDKHPQHHYHVADVTQPFPLKGTLFSHAVITLALQNIDKPEFVLKQASQHLQPNGKLVIVLNHPCFRIPRQSSWQVDLDKKIQYRRLDRYFSSMEIPIQAHPSKGKSSPSTWSFHHPISMYSQWLRNAGFAITLLDEWCSDKVSTGSAAKMENRSRSEFPLFFAILATNITSS